MKNFISVKFFSNFFFIFIIIFLIKNELYNFLKLLSVPQFFTLIIISSILVIIITKINYILLNLFFKINFKKTFKITTLNSIFNYFLPNSGYVANTLYLKSKFNFNHSFFLGINIFKSLISGLVFFLFGLIATIYEKNLLLITSFFFLALIFYLILFISLKNKLYFIKKYKKIHNIISKFYIFKSKLFKSFKKIFFYYIIYYLLICVLYSVLFYFFSIKLKFIDVMIICSLAIMTKYLVINFADFGTGELLMITYLFTKNIGFDKALSIILIQKFFYLLSSLILILVSNAKK